MREIAERKETKADQSLHSDPLMQEMEWKKKREKIQRFHSVLLWRGHPLSQLRGQTCGRCCSTSLMVNKIRVQLQPQPIRWVCIWFRWARAGTPGKGGRWTDVSNVFIKFSLLVFCYLRSRAVAVTTSYMKQSFIQPPKENYCPPKTIYLCLKWSHQGFWHDKLQITTTTHTLFTHTLIPGAI